MYERLVLIKELLSDSGNIYVHCDYHRNYYIRMILDEVFGANNFKNEILWQLLGWKKKHKYWFWKRHESFLF